FYKPVSYDNIPAPAMPKEYDPNDTTAEETPEVTTAEEVTTEEQTDAPDTTETTDTEKDDATEITTDTAPDTTGGTEPAGSGPNAGLIIGIIAGAVVLIGVIAFIIIKAKKKK
ncbi:MAG: hypothetical protein J6330_12225, partial [Clostridia bacterium]|nr:hypothetical protein [Clostridia bacterium]